MFKHFSSNNLNKIKYKFGNQTNNINDKLKKPYFMKFTRKFFNENNPLNRLLPITRGIVIGNMVMYGLSFFMSQREYINRFYYNTKSLEKGHILSLVTSHFTKMNSLDFIIDTFITAFMGNSIEGMVGTEMMKRLVLFSMVGSIFLIHVTSRPDEFHKPDTFIRLIIYTFAIRNPQQFIYFFPFPFKIKIMYIAGLVGALDLLVGKFSNFGPLLACLTLLKGKGF